MRALLTSIARRSRVGVLAALLALPALGAPARAATGQASFAIRPVHFDPAVPATKSYFVVPARSGQSLTSEFSVTNVGDRPGSVLLYPVDGATGQTSGVVYLDRRAPRRDVGSWLTLSADRLTLGPGESRIVPFRLHVPAGARPGQHVGGIVAENAALQTSRAARSGKHVGGFQIRIRQLTIVAVEVDLPGPRLARVQVTGIAPGGGHGYQQLLVGLRNTGTLLVKPTGSLVLVNERHRRVRRASFHLDSLLPATGIDYPLTLRGRPLPKGAYAASVVLRYGGHVTSAIRSFRIGGDEVEQVYSATPRPAGVPPPTSGVSVEAVLPWALAAFGLLVAAGCLLAVLRPRRTA